MKTRFFMPYLLIIVIIFSITGTARASMLNQEDGIMANHSAEYVRTLSRNASTDADAAFYNPAGLAFMKKQGLYIMFSNQILSVYKGSSFKFIGNDIQVGGMSGPQPFTIASHLALPEMYTTDKSGLPPDRYKAEIFSPIFPDLDLVYKGKDWAVYLDISVPQSAGLTGLNFPNGVPELDKALIGLSELTNLNVAGIWPVESLMRRTTAKREELYISGTVGGTYAFLDWLSAALGFRYIHATTRQVVSQVPISAVNGGVDLIAAGLQQNMHIDTETAGNGYGIIAGLHFKPVKGLDIGLRGEYYLPMVLRKDTKKFIANPMIAQSGELNIFVDRPEVLMFNDAINLAAGTLDFSLMDPRYLKDISNKLKVTYPSSLSIGLSYNILEELRIETSADLTFPTQRDLDGREHNFKPLGYRLGQCVEYTFIKMIAVSAGYSYNDFGIKPEKRNEVDPLLTSHSVGGGLTVKAMDGLDVTVGAFYSLYMHEKNTTINLTSSNIVGMGFTSGFWAWNKDYYEGRWAFAIGITARVWGEDHIFSGI